MSRRTTRSQTPDLLSATPPNQGPEVLTKPPPRRPALPKDLPKAIEYLDDAELDWLLRTAIQQAKRRGRPLPVGEAASTNKKPQALQVAGQVNSSTPDRASCRIEPLPDQRGSGCVQSRCHASRIARQFGPTASQVRDALRHGSG
jgi:hypothetical protein